jgi:hypothetical protein
LSGGRMWWAADASADPAWTFFAQAGLAGVMLFFFLRWAYGVYRTTKKDLDDALRREREAVAAAHDRERQQTRDLIDKYLPTMQEVTRVLADVLQVLRDSDRDRRR